MEGLPLHPIEKGMKIPFFKRNFTKTSWPHWKLGMWCEVRVKLVVVHSTQSQYHGTETVLSPNRVSSSRVSSWAPHSVLSVRVAVLVPTSQSAPSLWKPGGVSPPTMLFFLSSCFFLWAIVGPWYFLLKYKISFVVSTPKCLRLY